MTGVRDALVARFVPHMARELECNQWKGDAWTTMAVDKHVAEVLYHTAKLCMAAIAGHVDAVRELAADVANVAAMLADALCDLDDVPAVTEEDKTYDAGAITAGNTFGGGRVHTMSKAWQAELVGPEPF